ncbi:hypothetical protein M3689_05805 [Alkalihalophilus marmarensis]|uniref:hypothetical protein n=1 Tax=Alkalihalophilus marmarensis TaxID=521377 RepID=UPI00203D9215|nr:hypothetical protein [Alkalihalophilus marmarensis]MCM3488820.1 hypothetical protein [Alkalihalophilus marmarensis]
MIVLDEILTDLESRKRKKEEELKVVENKYARNIIIGAIHQLVELIEYWYEEMEEDE